MLTWKILMHFPGGWINCSSVYDWNMDHHRFHVPAGCATSHSIVRRKHGCCVRCSIERCCFGKKARAAYAEIFKFDILSTRSGTY
jgi:hypothetical protein